MGSQSYLGLSKLKIPTSTRHVSFNLKETGIERSRQNDGKEEAAEAGDNFLKIQNKSGWIRGSLRKRMRLKLRLKKIVDHDYVSLLQHFVKLLFNGIEIRKKIIIEQA